MKKLWMILTLIASSSVVLGGEVNLVWRDNSVKVLIDGDVFTVYRFGSDLPKPYFLPVTAPGSWDLLGQAQPGDETVAGRAAFVCDEPLVVGAGEELPFGTIVQVESVDPKTVKINGQAEPVSRSSLAPLAGTVTRLVNLHPPAIKDRKDPLYYDHPHHKGIWLSIDEVNGIKFWNEDGRIVSKQVEVVRAQGNPAVFKATNHWLKADGNPLVEQVTTWSVYADRFLTCDVTFKAVDERVTFGDTKEGMFAIRLPNSMREFISAGPVTNAEGVVGTAPCWGKESNWIDYVGKVDGHDLGVALLDHPGNPRRSRYHVRDYGLFAINPFGVHAYTNKEIPESPLVLEPKTDGARFRYGLYVHNGVLPEGAMQKRFDQFAAEGQ